jgi:SAM-dependent methyltransferase
VSAGLEKARHAALRRYGAARHRGSAVECPLCGARFSAFKPAWNRANAICWRCGSHERHRATWVHLQRHPELLRDARSLLHFAPEYCLERRMREVPGLRYVTADLDPALGELELDLTALALEDGAFDAILCSHVLEHVPDDAAAMRELHRVVAPGGWVLVMVPIDHSREQTFEDPAIVAPEARVQAFWQADHVRLYALDVADRLRAAGFEVTRATPAAELGPQLAARHGLLVEEDLFICQKGAGAAR